MAEEKNELSISHVPEEIPGPELTLDKQNRIATELEHELSTIEALKLYPQAVVWAAFFAFSLVMAGYDGGVIFNLFALQKFAEKYGTLYQGEYIITASWQTALSLGTPVGQVTGALLGAYVCDRLGRKLTFALCNVWTLAFIFMQFFSKDIKVLTAAEFLAGQMYGFYVVLAPTYASEVCPMALRGMLQASMNLAYVIGQFIAAGVAAGLQSRDDQWSYKAQFAVQWFWPPIFLVGLLFCPESPWWLVRQGRLDDAEKSLRKLSRKSEKVDIKATLAMIIETNEYEREIEKATSYWDCFKGVNLRRTEIAVGVQFFQVITGITLIGYATYFFELADFTQTQAFDMSVGNTAIGFVATCSSWPLMVYVGRRRIYMLGVAVMAVFLFIIGFLDIVKDYAGRPAVSNTQGAFLDLLTFVYQFTIGPICFVVFGEVSSTRLRSKTIAIACAVGSVISIALAVGAPYMLNPTAANWRGKTGFFFGAWSIIATVWCYYRLPEMKNRTQQEIDFMFDNHVATRQFKKYELSVVYGGSGSEEA